MLEKLTVIIPTYNRINFIKRSHSYWKKTQVNFLICDSSDKINDDLKNYKNYHYTKEKSFYNKLFKIIKNVNTKYVMIIADDDLACVDTLEKCVSFLEQNNEFVSAQGSFIDFWYDDNNKIDICVRNPSISAIDSNILETDSNLRINKSMNPYMHHVYSIHRKNVLKDALNLSRKLKNNPAAEINITLFGSIFGKHKMIECLYVCRQVVPISKINFTKSENFLEWLNNKKNKNYIKEWVNQLSIIHSNINNQSYDDANKTIFDTINSFNKKKLGLKSLSKNIIKFFIPKSFLNYFRHPLYYKKSWPPTKEEANKIRKLSTKELFYPWSDKESKSQWIKIHNFLKKYGKVEDNSFKI